MDNGVQNETVLVVPDALDALSARVAAAERVVREVAGSGAGLACGFTGDDGLDAELLRFQGAWMRDTGQVAETALATSHALSQAAAEYRRIDQSAMQAGGPR